METKKVTKVIKNDGIGLKPTVKLNNGNYEILDQLGEPGGFGITYLGYDIGLKSKVAIKEYFPRIYANRDNSMTIIPTASKENHDDFQWGYDAFKKEAQTIANLPKHPNVIDVKNLFEENGTVYFVMSYAKGIDLEQYLKENHPLNQKEIEGILYPFLDGVQHIHKHNILHRDIKLANILITEEKQPILIDFGTARNELNQRVKKMTAVYTEGYAALEQHTESKEGTYTDIYAIGMLIYSLINGITETRLLPSAIKRFEALHSKNTSLLTFPDDGRFSKNFINATKQALQVEVLHRPQTIEDFLSLLKEGRPEINKNYLKFSILTSLLFVGVGISTYVYTTQINTSSTPKNNSNTSIQQGNNQTFKPLPLTPAPIKVDYLKEAQESIQKSDIPSAIKYLKNELQINKSPKIAFQIAQLYESLNNELNNAILWYEKAEEMGNLKAKYPLAVLYCKQGNYAKFTKDSKGIFKFAKNSRKEFKYDIGLCFNEIGNMVKAQEWFEYSAKLNYPLAKESLFILLTEEGGKTEKQAYTHINNLMKEN